MTVIDIIEMIHNSSQDQTRDLVVRHHQGLKTAAPAAAARTF
jgi:hypothetical protein